MLLWKSAKSCFWVLNTRHMNAGYGNYGIIASVLSPLMAIRPSCPSHCGVVVETGALEPTCFHHLSAELFTSRCLCVPIQKIEI